MNLYRESDMIHLKPHCSNSFIKVQDTETGQQLPAL